MSKTKAQKINKEFRATSDLWLNFRKSAHVPEKTVFQHHLKLDIPVDTEKQQQKETFNAWNNFRLAAKVD